MRSCVHERACVSVRASCVRARVRARACVRAFTSYLGKEWIAACLGAPKDAHLGAVDQFVLVEGVPAGPRGRERAAWVLQRLEVVAPSKQILL